MSFIKRYLEDTVDELAKELHEDWCDVNDIFMEFVSNGNPVDLAKLKTKEYFYIDRTTPQVIDFNNDESVKELVGEGGYNFNEDDYDPLALWDQPWWLLSEEEQNKVREQLKNKAKARRTNERV